MQEELLETLRAGPGEAARQEVVVAESGPAPSRWTLRTIRVSVEWLTGYTLSGVWRVLHACGLGVHASCARLFSPDPDYRRKVRRLHRCLRDAARHPDTVVALFLDEFGYQRWPEVAPTWGLEAAVAQRAGNNQQFVGDYTNPILKPEAAATVKRLGEISQSRLTYPTPSNRCWPSGVPYIFFQPGMEMLQLPHGIVFLYLRNHEFRHVRARDHVNVNRAPRPLGHAWKLPHRRDTPQKKS